jgi:hypothetical protein
MIDHPTPGSDALRMTPRLPSTARRKSAARVKSKKKTKVRGSTRAARETPLAAFGFIESMECLSVAKLLEGFLCTYEIKLDGFRLEAVKASGETTLYSRRGNPLNRKFPYIAEALKKLPDSTIIDGEVVALDAKQRSDFSLLQSSTCQRLSYVKFRILKRSLFGTSFIVASYRYVELTGHPNKISKRMGPHLPHDLAAMNLERNFLDSQYRCGLLIEETAYYEWKHLSLSRTQVTELLSQGNQLRSLIPERPILPECHLYRGEKRFRLDRLCQEFNRTCLHCLHGNWDAAIPADEYNRWATRAHQSPLQIKAVNPR